MTESSSKMVWSGGEVLFAGGTDWSKLGRSDWKKKQRKSKTKEDCNLISPHRLKGLAGVKIKFISSGPSACHCVATDISGQVYIWGRNEHGQLGLGDVENRKIPTLLEELVGKEVVGASCGKKHTVFVTADGFSWTSGSNGMGQCGTGVIKSREKFEELIKTPTKALVEDCTHAVCGAEFTLWLCAGQIFAAGHPQYGVLGDGSNHEYNAAEACVKLRYDPVAKPQQIQSLKETKIVRIAAGPYHCLAVDSDGIPYSWGYGGYGRLGHHIQQDEFRPRPISTMCDKLRANLDNLVLAAGGTTSFCTSVGGLLFSWGRRKPSADCEMYPTPFLDFQGWDVRSMACGSTTFAVAAESSVITWGAATNGECGKGHRGKKSSANPEKCEGLEDMYTHQVACGTGFTMFLVDPHDEKVAKFPVYDPEEVDSNEEEATSEEMLDHEVKRVKRTTRRRAASRRPRKPNSKRRTKNKSVKD